MSNKPKFPFRIITTWIHPSEKSTCEVCKAPGATYALENYIGMERMVGTDMYVKLTNDHWVRAIKAQSREQFDVTLTGYMCIACLNKMHSAGFSDASDVPKWHKALAILSDKYGEVAVVHFILVNTYDDEGVLFWFLCPLMDNIEIYSILWQNPARYP
jgi:hypothetical protein